MEAITNIFYIILFLLFVFIIGIVWDLGLGAVVEIVKRIISVKPQNKEELKMKYPITSDIEDYAVKKFASFKGPGNKYKKTDRLSDTNSLISSLRDIEDLRIKGIISQVEFDRLKAEILKS